MSYAHHGCVFFSIYRANPTSGASKRLPCFRSVTVASLSDESILPQDSYSLQAYMTFSISRLTRSFVRQKRYQSSSFCLILQHQTIRNFSNYETKPPAAMNRMPPCRSAYSRFKTGHFVRCLTQPHVAAFCKITKRTQSRPLKPPALIQQYLPSQGR